MWNVGSLSICCLSESHGSTCLLTTRSSARTMYSGAFNLWWCGAFPLPGQHLSHPGSACVTPSMSTGSG